MFKVNEIFKSIEGEGVRTGLPCTFIRLYGCNLKCSYCDTRYSCENEEYTPMSLAQIVIEVVNLGGRRVTITGGEPLLHQEIELLIAELRSRDFEVNIETNGSMYIGYCTADIITMDYKGHTSMMEPQMLLSNIKLLRKQDVLKFVVGSLADLMTMKAIIKDFRPKCRVYVSPIFGMIEPSEIVDFILHEKLEDVTVQVQLHKIIWEPSKRGV